jgi:hypothetical protein
MDMAFEEQMALTYDKDGTDSNRVEELTVLFSYDMVLTLILLDRTECHRMRSRTFLGKGPTFNPQSKPFINTGKLTDNRTGSGEPVRWGHLMPNRKI